MASLREILKSCSVGDELICTHLDSRDDIYFTENKSYKVTVDNNGDLCILDDDGYALSSARSSFFKVPSSPSQSPQVAPREEATDTPKSVVDGDYSEHDTWGIGNKPHKKVKQWKPDTIREDIDIMESIRHACNRT